MLVDLDAGDPGVGAAAGHPDGRVGAQRADLEDPLGAHELALHGQELALGRGHGDVFQPLGERVPERVLDGSVVRLGGRVEARDRVLVDGRPAGGGFRDVGVRVDAPVGELGGWSGSGGVMLGVCVIGRHCFFLCCPFLDVFFL